MGIFAMVGRCASVRQVIRSAGILGVLAGCAATPMGPTVQVMPAQGKTFEMFQADLAACKYFAAAEVQGQADAANQRAAGGALLTAVLGAGLGAVIGGAGGNAAAGAAIGAATGAGGGAIYGANASTAARYNIQQQYDDTFAQCMYAKGNQIPGFAPPPAPVAYSIPSSAPVAVADPLVRETQSELIRLGYLRGQANGIMSPRTYAAIANFEQANGMPPDGIPSPRLLATLQSTPASAAPAFATAPGNWGGPAGWVAPPPSMTQ